MSDRVVKVIAQGPPGPPSPGPRQTITTATSSVDPGAGLVIFDLAGVTGPIECAMPTSPQTHAYMLKDMGTADAVAITLTDPNGHQFEQPDGSLADTLVLSLKGAGVTLLSVNNTWRLADTVADLAHLDASKLTTGTVPDARFPANLPAVGGGALTGLTAAQVTWPSQSANVVWAGPANGANAAPAWRALADADLPGGSLVNSFNTRTGAVTLTGADVNTALTYTAADAAALNASALTSGTVPLTRIVGLTNIQIDAAASIGWTKVDKAGSSLADLTTRSASDLTSGTLPDARFPATLPAVSGVNLSGVEKTSNRGAANGYASLGPDGKVLGAQLPALAITDTFPVASQAAMLALTAERGDVAVRSDLNKSFILKADDPTILANWQELLTPTDAVLSVSASAPLQVNAATGAVNVSLASQAPNTVLAGPTSGANSAPTMRGLVASDLPGGSIVNSFNTRTGAVTLTGDDVMTAAGGLTAAGAANLTDKLPAIQGGGSATVTPSDLFTLLINNGATYGATASQGGILTASAQGIGGDKTAAGNWTFQGTVTGTGTKLWDNSGTIRATGDVAAASGKGAELKLVSSTTATLQGYDRTGAAYIPTVVAGSNIALAPGGTTTFTAASTVNTHTVPERLKSYTVATLPAASVGAGAIAYASDAGGNGPCIAISNGSAWKRCDNTSTTVA